MYSSFRIKSLEAYEWIRNIGTFHLRHLTRKVTSIRLPLLGIP